MFERFTEQACQVVSSAQEEARRFGHFSVGTEHELLGLLRVRHGLAAEVLSGFGVSTAAARAQIRDLRGAASEVTGDQQLPFTEPAKAVLELAQREALAAGSRVRPEHLLLGLTARKGDGADQVLARLGADGAQIRREIERRLAGADPGETMLPRASAARPLANGTALTPVPDQALRRLLAASAGFAFTDERTEFTLVDMLRAFVHDRESAQLLARYGIDLEVLRARLDPETTD